MLFLCLYDIAGVNPLFKSCCILQDNNIRLWSLETGNGTTRCVAIGLGHTHDVGAVAISK